MSDTNTLEASQRIDAEQRENRASEETTPIDAEAIKAEEERAAQEKAEKEKEADKVLQEAVKSFRKGEKEYSMGLLECGRLCGEYLRQRLALGASRKAIVQTVEGQLARFATDSVDVNRLVRSYEAYRLLGATKKTELPYGFFRDAFSRLVQRANMDTSTETYVLLAGMEQDCLDCFALAIKDKLDKTAIAEKVSTIVRKHTAKEAEEKEVKAKVEREAARLKAEQAEAARKATAEAEATKKQLEQQAETAKNEGKAEEAAKLTQAIETASDTLRETQKAEIAAHAEAAQTAQQAAQAEKDRKAAETAQRNQLDKDRRKAEAVLANEANKPKGDTRQENYLQAAKQGTAKDVANMASELITGCQEPDSTLEWLLHVLDGHKELSKQSHRAIKAALVVLAKSTATAAVA